jgi:hypothetical protein
MLIAKDIAQELAYSDGCEGYKVIERKIVGHTRWSIISRIVIEKDGKYYSSSYSEGATESQEESAFEYSPDEIDFKEAQKKEVLVTVYE